MTRRAPVRTNLDPYTLEADARQGWKRGLCGRPYCNEPARWSFVDRAGRRRNLCVGHGYEAGVRT